MKKANLRVVELANNASLVSQILIHRGCKEMIKLPFRLLYCIQEGILLYDFADHRALVKILHDEG